MRRSRMATQYDKLTHRERLGMVLKAMSRDDEAEEKRLWETCPTKSYRAVDAGFERAYDVAHLLAPTAGLQLMYELGQLDMLDRCAGILPHLILLAARESEDAIRQDVDGQTGGSQCVPKTPDAATGSTSSGGSEGSIDVNRMFAEQMPRTGKLVDRLLDEMFRAHAGRVEAVLLGLDRFAQSVLGVDAKTLIAAFIPAVLDEIEKRSTAGAEPDEELAKELEKRAWETWKQWACK